MIKIVFIILHKKGLYKFLLFYISCKITTNSQIKVNKTNSPDADDCSGGRQMTPSDALKMPSWKA